MESSLFLRTIFCCSDREYEFSDLGLCDGGKSFVIANGSKFWIVGANCQREALDKLVSKTWNNSHFDYRIYGCGWGDYEYIVAELQHRCNYAKHTGTDTDFLKSLPTVQGNVEVYITEEYRDPEDFELWPSMPI
ncbi:hypothetical protein [Vibrio agarivorans]|uniref:Uncharacterized protein n=1 Tax=Vibrio agarivorans TaxID=153622 RepID=A0ABT7Y7J0_9VIBR|nr:hypothetical protein [Vibrio agarivorans]MDN2484011.1 hypothetical protein [Vibrio agarivorans]